MKIRIVDYRENQGGIERFLNQLFLQFRAMPVDAEFEVVSDGTALAMYRGREELARAGIKVIEIERDNIWRFRPATRFHGIPRTTRIQRFLGAGDMSQGYYCVAPSVYAGCDVVWVPSVSGHRVPARLAHRTVGTLHDITAIVFDGLLPLKYRRQELETHRRWLASRATVLTTSQTTRGALEKLYHRRFPRLSVVPILARHQVVQMPVPEAAQWASRPYLFCPANLSLHKNHSVLFRGVSEWGKKHPVVLSGRETDLATSTPRSSAVREDAASLGFEIGKTLIPLGYIQDARFQAVLNGAWALIMPTLAEGGGSYPVLEAMLAGVPVLCSDIPVMREQIERTGGELLWFDPHDPHSLADRLCDLELHYDAWRTRAHEQMHTLKLDSWSAIAQEYWQAFTQAAMARGRFSIRRSSGIPPTPKLQ